MSCLSLVGVGSHGHSALLPPAPLPLRASLIPFLVIKNLLAISLTAPWHVVLPVSGDPELVFSFFFFLGKAVLLISLADPFLPMSASRAALSCKVLCIIFMGFGDGRRDMG